MSCLLPHFKCPSPSPSPSDALLRTCRRLHVKARDTVCFRSQCVLSPITAVIDIEKLQISSLEAQSAALSFVKPLTYLGDIDPSAKTNFGATWDTEALLTCEDEEIAAAAAEAVALARAAVEAAKDATQMSGNDQSVNMETSDDFLSESDMHILQLERVKLGEMEHVDSTDDSATLDADISRFMVQEQNMQHSKSIAMRSGRQTERRARRVRAADKVANSVVTMKGGSSVRKKRPALQEIDYSDPLHYLRGMTSTSKLLTASDELELSEGIQVLLKLEKLQEELAEKNGCKPTFSQWAEAAGVDQRTLRKQLNHGIMCKDKMVKSNIRLVISIAKNYQGVGLNLQDLVQEGCRGLVKGAEKFDASKGFKFSTYAHWWIKQAVRKSLSDQSRTIRLPFHMVDATYRVREATKQLFSKNGRYPEKEEIAEATGLTMTRLTTVMLTPKAPRSLDQKIGINESLKPSDVISDPSAQTPEEILMNQFMRQDLDEVLDSLRPREKQVVRWRFGLEDGRTKTLQEIGELMDISRERVRQIESSAFRKLRNKRKTSNLRQYLYL